MKYKVLGYIFIVLVFAATVSLLYYQQVVQSIPDYTLPPVHTANLKIYTNNQYGFSASYDKGYVLDTLGGQQNYFKTGGTTLTDISIPSNLYPNTNLGSADVSFAVMKNSVGVDCQSYITGAALPGQMIKTQTISGNIFYTAEFSGAAAGTKYDTQLYRIRHNGTCYEINLTIGIANINNFDPSGGVTAVDENDVWNRLGQILQTFKFSDSSSATTKGTLNGHVTVGPICPVEQVGHPCQPSPQAYMVRQVGVFTQDGSKLITSQHLDANGNYQFSLDPGIYTIKASGMMVDQLTALEGIVTIKGGQATTLNFSIDTGIR